MIRKEGKKVSVKGWMLIGYRVNGLNVHRYAWTIPKYVGVAVLRNKLKRWGREFFKNSKSNDGVGLDLNVVFRRQPTEFYKNLTHKEYDSTLQTALERIYEKVG